MLLPAFTKRLFHALFGYGTSGQALVSNGSGADATWQTFASGPAAGNPTGTITLTAANGVATTYMRSDAAPALDQAISPTWTGSHRFRATVYLGNTGVASGLLNCDDSIGINFDANNDGGAANFYQIAKGGTGFGVPMFRVSGSGVVDFGANALKVLAPYPTPGGTTTIAAAPRTPAQITTDQNDYNPGTGWFYRLSTDASRALTGLGVGQVDGQAAEVWNVGANNLVLAHQSASSAAANRFICTGAADITLAADEVALLRYDAAASRWRVRKV